MEHIKVFVVEFSDRKSYQMQFVDPVTGRKKTRSTKVERTGRKRERTEAERVADKWEAELRDGRGAGPSKFTWAEFRERYEDEVLSSLAANTAEKVGYIFDAIERELKPTRLIELTDQRVSHFQAILRKAGKSESTIKGNLAHLKAALRWAERVELMTRAPRVLMPRRAKGAKGTDPLKGRPISGEEFDRMLAKVPAVVGETLVDGWRGFLEGLCRSELRITEALTLTWDDQRTLRLDLTGKFPMLRIPAESEKGNKDRLLPVAPEFAEWLQQTPPERRTGFVFLPIKPQGFGRANRDVAIRTVSKLGKNAGVKVHTNAAGKVKYASAHDLRRSFGERWAVRVMPQVLKELMRHESIETTLRFYVGRNAETTARALGAAYDKPVSLGNTFGNTDDSRHSADCSKSIAEAGLEPARG